MSKYVLFGTDSIAQKLIRTATQRNFRILCPIPHPPHISEERNYEQIALIKRLGGEPILFNFRPEWNPAAEKTGPEGLKQIFKDTKGVIWAIDPDFKELGSWSYYRDLPRGYYLRDFKTAISAMIIENGPRNFVSLLPHEKEMSLDELSCCVASTMKEAVLGPQQDLKWAFVRTMDGNETERRLHVNSPYENMIHLTIKDLLVPTMMRILETDNFNSKILSQGTACEEKRALEDVITIQGVEVAQHPTPNRMGTSPHFVC
jgi:hypothetical protein